MGVGVAASGATALSLGNAQGTVVLGRPLDLVFPIQTDGAQLADACVSAEITAGDAQLPASQVRISPEPARAGSGVGVRVQTTQPVREPVLGVRLAAGCTGSVVRNYTVLAFPEEALTPRQRAAANPVAAPRPAVAAPVPSVSSAAAGNAAARRSSESRAEPAPPQRARRSRAETAPPPKGEDAGRPRLVMEPLSDWLEAPSMLRASPEIATLSPASPAQREEAAARWRALNLEPQELLQEAARLVAQETELAKLRADAERDKAATLAVQQELEQRAAERFPAVVVYVLGALLLLLAGLLLWMWSRVRGDGTVDARRWNQAVAQNAASSPPAAARSAQPAPAEHHLRAQPTEPQMLPSGMIPLEFGVSQDAPLAPTEETSPVAADGSESITAVVNPEDLFDLQQQAEFFVSVGEHDQAIDVMKKHIEANQETSPLAYLELLRLYRSLSRIEQYNALRAQFHRFFNAQVPEFAAFARQGKGLFAYPEVLARIEALWCDPSVVSLLQELLFRGTGEQQRFDLPAYDDLLLLHAIARTTPPGSRGASSARTRTTPLVPTDWEPPRAELAEPPAPAQPSNLMEFEQDWAFEAPTELPATPAEGTAARALDLDLSDLTHLDALSERAEQDESNAPLPFLTQEEQPPVQRTAPPAPHQPVGFGSNSDRFEARVDPDVRKPR